MTKKVEQNSEVYSDIVNSGKSLLQLYLELKELHRNTAQITDPAPTNKNTSAEFLRISI